ncbi:hypothetical protein COU58_02705 [Candidatus Pacearchaeota archaeon CG10_big_fil_rev_8_21_14_0_10_32_42]|nr:MAG: hypothetical protein COU58_02705 [Candidatus Pacearchaeota archaeon CG10_big_fil_rev_8_21_14_0_10_32_42]
MKNEVRKILAWGVLGITIIFTIYSAFKMFNTGSQEEIIYWFVLVLLMVAIVNGPIKIVFILLMPDIIKK